MNIGMSITTTVLILLVVAPVALMQQQQKKKEHKLLKALKTLASKHNATISQHDVFGNFAIGMDKANKALFFYKKNVSEVISKYINLNEIRSCGISYSKKPTQKNKQGDIVKLELILNPIDNHEDKHVIELYNHAIDFQLNGELEISHKWEQLIQNNLT